MERKPERPVEKGMEEVFVMARQVAFALIDAKPLPEEFLGWTQHDKKSVYLMLRTYVYSDLCGLMDEINDISPEKFRFGSRFLELVWNNDAIGCIVKGGPWKAWTTEEDVRAAVRHMCAHVTDEDFDPDDPFPHTFLELDPAVQALVGMFMAKILRQMNAG